MIYLKSPKEIEIMREGGIILGNLLDILLPNYIKAGMSGKDVEAFCEEYIVSKGGNPMLKGYGVGAEVYEHSICFSINEEVVHGLPSSSKVLKDGDIVGVDMAIEWKGYHVDKARTYAIGETNAEAKKLLDVTKEALRVGINKFRIGNRIGDISEAVQRFVESNNMSVIRKFTGHGIGKSLHEDPYVPNYGYAGTGALIEEGMVLAIEPMVNLGHHNVEIGKDGWGACTLDGKWGSHFEDTVAICNGVAKILTDSEGV